MMLLPELLVVHSTSIPKKWNNISDVDLGWGAGIIDGEGTLNIGYSRNTWRCAVAVQNTSKEIIDKLEEIFGGSICPTKYKYKGIYRPAWIWWIIPLEIKGFLLLLYPYLVAKKKQAELLIEMRRRIEERVGIEMVYRNMTRGNKAPCLTNDEREIRQSMYYEVKKYNHREE